VLDSSHKCCFGHCPGSEVTNEKQDTVYQTKEWLTNGQSVSYVAGSMSYYVRIVENITLSDTYIENMNTMQAKPINEACAERERK
jgi:hypothetical protein